MSSESTPIDVRALCKYCLECAEKDPAEAWVTLMRLANAGATAWEMNTHLTEAEMRKILDSVRQFRSLD